MKERLVVFWYRGHLAYCTENEYKNRMDYMYCILPNYRDFDEVKDYLVSVCNYDNYIVDMTEAEDDAN